MNRLRLSMLSTCLIALLPAWIPVAAADADDDHRVEVILVEPDGFTDVKPERLFGEFHDYLQQQAARRLASGNRLVITVTNIDMAGGYDLTQGHEFSTIRQMRATFPPRIDLSFVLSDADGRVLMEGERRLRDLSYLMRVRAKTETDLLYYEKRLVDEWLMREFSG